MPAYTFGVTLNNKAMNPFRSNVGTLNEILFENKNKAYGAYAIRAAYGSTVFKSLGITTSAILGSLWMLSLALGKEAEVVVPVTGDAKTLVTYTINLEEPKKQVQDNIEKPKSAAAATKSNSLLNAIIKDQPRTDSLKIAVNETVTTSGTGTLAATATTAVTGTTSTGTGTLTTGGGSETPTWIPEVWPTFAGGLQAFWAKNIKYPTAARENGIEGVVAVNFVLDETGKVIDATIIKKLGFGCDEEVLRVVKLMPNWTPGKMGGKPVKVSFNQTVNFKLR